MILDPLVAFSFELLLDAGTAKRPLTVCPLGHLVVNGNSHYSPEAFVPGEGLGPVAVSCRIVDACDATAGELTRPSRPEPSIHKVTID